MNIFVHEMIFMRLHMTTLQHIQIYFRSARVLAVAQFFLERSVRVILNHCSCLRQPLDSLFSCYEVEVYCMKQEL